MAVIEEISSNIFVISVGTTPRSLKLSQYRGDAFSLVLIGKNGFDNIPFNFALANTILMQFRAGHPRSEIVEAEFSLANGYITLDQTDAATAAAAGLTKSAVQYDIDEGNPDGTTKDMLLVTDHTGLLLNTLVDRLYFDTQITLNPDPITLTAGWCDFTFDVSRSTS